MARKQPYLQATRLEVRAPVPAFAPRRRPIGIWLAVGSLAFVVAAVTLLTPRASDPSAAAGVLSPTAPPRDVAAAVVPPAIATSAPDPPAIAGLPTPAASEGGAAPASSAAYADPSAVDSVAPSQPAVTPPAVGDSSGPDPTTAKPTSVAPEALKGYRWPLFQARITSFFAPRDTGFLVVDGQRIHQGLDITTWCGDQVRAAHAGKVLAAGRHFGNVIGFITHPDAFYAKVDREGTLGELPIVVVVDDGNGYRSMYVHLSEALVKVGDTLRAGQVLGLEGMTGNATGCHLHYELVRMDGPWMKVASERVRDDHYPAWQRERIDPLRVLSMKDKRAANFVPGIDPPRVSPGLGRPTAHLP